MADELKASPTFPGQELIGGLGRVAEQLGISLQDATKIISQQGNSPIKAFLADLLVAAPLRSAGTALQDYTGTPRDLTEEHPYSRLLSGKGMTLRLDPVGKLIDQHHFDNRLNEMIDQHMAGGGVMKAFGKAIVKKLSPEEVVEPSYKEIGSMVSKLGEEGRYPILPAPNRWFLHPDKFPNQQKLIERVLEKTGKSREDFTSGAFIDARTGDVLDSRIMDDLGVVIDPKTNRPMMSAKGQSNIEQLDPKTGAYTKSNLVRKGLFKPEGGDPLLNDLSFLATIERGDVGHKYGLATEYASPTELYNTGKGANPTLRPRSRGDLFGVGDVVGQVRIGRREPHDVYEKLFVAPKGSDVQGVKLSKARGGAMAGGGLAKGIKAGVKMLFNDNVLPAPEAAANLQRFLEPSKAPMRLYHGTTATEGGKGVEAIRRLKPSKDGALGSGTYLTPSTAHASGYSGSPNDEAIAAMLRNDYQADTGQQFLRNRQAGNVLPGQEGGNMLPVYAQIKNPLIIEGTHGDPMVEALTKLGMDEGKASRMVERAYENKGYIGKEVQSRAQAQGYDGLMQYRDGELSEVVSYNPNAVKSAIGNQGTYDISQPDLSKAEGGVAHMKDGGTPRDFKPAETPEQEIMRYLRMLRVNAIGGVSQGGASVNGRLGVDIPVSENVSIEPYVQGFAGFGKPQGGGGANLKFRFGGGGGVFGLPQQTASEAEPIRLVGDGEIKASPMSFGQESLGKLGQVVEKLGITVEEAMKIVSKEGNSPVKAFLFKFLFPDLRSVGTALQDYTGTPRDATEDYPYAPSTIYGGSRATINPNTWGPALQTFKTDPRVFDTAESATMFAGPVASAGVQGAKLAGKGALAATRAGERFAEKAVPKIMERGGIGAEMLGALNQNTQSRVIKPKGGNFLPEGTLALDQLKSRGVAVMPLNETELAERIAQGYTVHDPATGTYSKPDPINQWIDKQLTRYVKNEMATPEDPIRALAERGTLHFDAPQVNPTDALDLKRQQFAAGNNEKWGYGESRLAQNWEDASDKIINKLSAGDYLNQRHLMFDTPFDPKMDFLNKVSSDTPLYGVNRFSSVSSNSIDSLGFPHLIDELRNATNPASGLPRELLLKPESLARLSVPQAVERVAKINEWRTGNIKKARLEDAANTDVHKEYKDTGMRWVKLNKPGQFKAESDAMGHSVRGYEPTEGGGSSGYGLGGYDAIKSGDAEVYSLRDAKNEPHATIEVGVKKEHPLYYQIPDDVAEQLQAEGKRIGNQKADAAGHGKWSKKRELEQRIAASELKDNWAYNNPITSNRITQIKGKSNRAPNEEYLPYVQDFVKSGKWSDVKDFHNTGLIKTHRSTGLSRDISPEMSGNARQLAYGRARAAGEIQPYMTKAELETVMKKHAPEDIWSRPGQPMTEADITGPWEPEGMKRGGPVNLDAMQMAVWNKPVKKFEGGVAHMGAGGLAKAIPSNLAKLMKLLTTEAPLQAPQIRKALGQAFTTGNEHSVVGPTHSTPNESGRVGRITTQGKESAVSPDQFDIQNAVRGKSSIVDFHSHPADSGRAFSTSPSSADFHFTANEYFPGPESRELKTLIASPADTALRTPTEYLFFATGTPGKAFDRRAREAAVYELQRSGKNTFKDVLDDPRFRDYFESGGRIGDWAEDVAPLALLKLREAQALGRGKLQLSGKPLAASGGTNIELYDLMQPAATEFLRNKGFDKGGSVNLDAMRMAVTNKQLRKRHG